MRAYTEKQIVKALVYAAATRGGVAGIDLTPIGGCAYRIVASQSSRTIRLEMNSSSVYGSCELPTSAKPGMDGVQVATLIDGARAVMARECRLIMEA